MRALSILLVFAACAHTPSVLPEVPLEPVAASVEAIAISPERATLPPGGMLIFDAVVIGNDSTINYELRAVTVDPMGRIIAAGRVMSDGQNGLLLMRFWP